jgi:hypothetical protein
VATDAAAQTPHCQMWVAVATYSLLTETFP